MDLQRNFFLLLFIFVSFLLFQLWKVDFNYLNILKNQLLIEKKRFLLKENKIINSNRHAIYITSDVLSLKINMYGGDVEKAELLKYQDQLKSKNLFQILKTTPKFIYQAESGITGPDGPDNLENKKRAFYKSEKKHYYIKDNEEILSVPITFTNTEGIIYTKIFILKKGEYSITVEHNVDNTTKRKLQLSVFGQLKQTSTPPANEISYNNFVLQTFRGAAYSTDVNKYKKYQFEKILNNENLNIKTKKGWIAMLQQYFVTAWIPNIENQTFYTNKVNDELVAIGYKSNNFIIEPHSKKKFSATLWIGPEIQNKMENIAPYLDLTVDYGWLWFISQPLFKLLKLIYSFFKNWGISIILITFLVRFVMYPLTKVQYSSAAKMRMLQPKIKAMQEKFGNNKSKLSQEMISLYKSEKVNPLGGCFPLLIQMPIFLGLYYMLVGSVELRHAHFVLWIHDLAAQDPYYILPILMGITMYFIQKITPSTITDPLQKKIMIYMPVFFTIFFLWFPAGLVLYYIVSNLVTILQQHLIYRALKKQNKRNL